MRWSTMVVFTVKLDGRLHVDSILAAAALSMTCSRGLTNVDSMQIGLHRFPPAAS